MKPARRVVALAARCLIPLLCLAVVGACRESGSAEDGASAPGLRVPTGAAAGTAGELRLELSAVPEQGEAPLTVRFEARLVGEVADPELFACPTLAWTLDGREGGQVVIAQAEDCQPGKLPREFRLSHTYDSARSYEATVRMIARPVPPSNLVQILVRGATPTAAPAVAFPGPTIVIATPAAPTQVAQAPTAMPSAEAPTRAVPSASPEPRERPAGASPSAATETFAPPAPTQIAARPTGMLITVVPSPGAAGPAGFPTTPETPGPGAGAQAGGLGTVAPRATGTGTGPAGAPAGQEPAPATAPPSAGTGTAAAILPPTAPSEGGAIPTRPPAPRTATPPPGRPQEAAPPPSPSAPSAPGVRPGVPTRPGGRPTAPVPATLPPARAPESVPGAASLPAPAAVLPGDLYYLAGDPGRVWRLPASGESPTALTEAKHPVDGFAVSPLGAVAFLSDGALYLQLPDTGSATRIDGGATAPAWSRNGRRLAYLGDGLQVYDLVERRRQRLAPAGEPLAWSRDGSMILARLAPDRLGVIDTRDGETQALTAAGVAEASWLPDREVAWLAGAGLRLLAVGDYLTLTPLLPAETATRAGFARPDEQLLFLAQGIGGEAAWSVNLRAPQPAASRVGPPLGLEDADAAWAPDGRHLAAAGPAGLSLVDGLSGAAVPILASAARQPQWVLQPRAGSGTAPAGAPK